MRIREAYPSKYVSTDDIKAPVRCTISGVLMEQVGEGQKPVCYFKGGDKGLVLNKTNGIVMADAFGDDTDDWVGKVIELRVEPTMFKGKPDTGTRVYPIFEQAGLQVTKVTESDVPF